MEKRAVVIHPTNRVFPSGSVMPTVQESYDEGFMRGLWWPDSWETHAEPGGPFIYRGDHEALRAHSMRTNEAWRRGWKEGHEAKKRVGLKVPFVW